MKKTYVTGSLRFKDIDYPVVSTSWDRNDRLGALRVRWSIGRRRYRVPPGLYAIGSPEANSNVYVSANYKLSFDHLRKALDGLNAWILVIDTKGINVWCAAGKKNFSTKEVVRRIRIHHLDQVVTHHRLILPQLSATGVAAHVVKRMTGFTVTFGPVLAADIKPWLDAGMRATPEMRTITFPLKERLKLVPVDVFYAEYYMLLVPVVFLVLSGLTKGGYSLDKALTEGWKAPVNLLAGYLTGIALTPLFLPWIPFRRFSLKGFALGMLTSALLFGCGMLGRNPVEVASWTLMISGLAAFMAMNFTGSSTFTSLSGVQQEMKIMLPVEISSVALGLAGWIITRFINF